MTEAETIAARYGATLRPGVSVQKIPTGQSSEVQARWNGAQLTYDLTPKERRARFCSGGYPTEQKRRQIEDRRKRVAELTDKGLSAARVAEILEVHPDTVFQDRRVIRDRAAQPVT